MSAMRTILASTAARTLLDSAMSGALHGLTSDRPIGSHRQLSGDVARDRMTQTGVTDEAGIERNPHSTSSALPPELR